jgi:hypothetical protein
MSRRNDEFSDLAVNRRRRYRLRNRASGFCALCARKSGEGYLCALHREKASLIQHRLKNSHPNESARAAKARKDRYAALRSHGWAAKDARRFSTSPAKTEAALARPGIPAMPRVPTPPLDRRGCPRGWYREWSTGNIRNIARDRLNFNYER